MKCTQANKAEPKRTIIQFPRSATGLDPVPLDTAARWVESINNRLEQHIVAVPPLWEIAVAKDKCFPRACFDRAVDFVARSPHLPDAVYVVGIALCGGSLNQNHGWVEIDDSVVFDGVMQQFYDKAGYYTSERVEQWYRFTREAVMFMLRRMQNDSSLTFSWDVHLDLPWADDPNNPLLVDLDRAKSGFESWKARHK